VRVISPDPEYVDGGNKPVPYNKRKSFDPRPRRFWFRKGISGRDRAGGECISVTGGESP